MSRRLTTTAVLAAAMAVGSIAHAELSRGVIAAFHGQLVISDGDLPEGKNDRDTIAKIKAARLTTLTGTASADVTYWHFHYTAFPSRTGATTLKLQFLSDKRLSADQRLDGVDPKSSALTGDISISEDEGLTKGKTYTVQLVTDKDQVVCSTTLTMK
ncbi:MAG TPA: hypothetical protein VLX92_04440 [Kofleriaceae bacterium]|nr:hypothetical protein [Kofleriaceae bacterium]